MTNNNTENNKRIAKNTLMLYFRMMLTMAVSLFTVRVVLNTLGTVDYGIYNVVGGVVTMFSFLSSTMASASQRFFAFELGKKDFKQLKRTFSMSLLIYIFIAVLILILAETIGLWFLINKMNIPENRMHASMWVYQFSIFSFMMAVFTIPYDAIIIANEKMNVYAYVSIIEVILKLVIVYLLVVFSLDKLILYSILTFTVTTIVTFIYRTYSIRNFKECKFSFYWDKNLYKEIMSYSGWNLFGALAGVLNGQGINIVLNIFFGPVVNAARGVAFQVGNAISRFVQNFMTAANPQITKYYATGEYRQMHKLVFQSSKFSYLLLLIISLPFLLETNYVLTIWLKVVPEYVIVFTRLIIITTLIESLSYSLTASAQATGRIKYFLLIVAGTKLLNLPLSYLFLKLGYLPEIVFYIGIIIALICLLLRLILLKNLTNLNVILYLKTIILPIILVTCISFFIPYFILIKLESGIIRLISITSISLLTSILSSYRIAFSKQDREYFISIVKTKLSKAK